MPDVLIRDLDPGTLRHLKSAATAHGRSLQAEIHHVLTLAAMRRIAQTRRLSDSWLRRLRRSAGSRRSDSTALIREDRDRR